MQSSLFYWLWDRAKLYIAIMSKRAWIIKESCNSETDSDDRWSLNSLLWYTSDRYWVDQSWESLQELKHWVSMFHAVNMQEYDMILDYSWLDEIDLNICWHKRRWSYQENSIQRAK